MIHLTSSTFLDLCHRCCYLNLLSIRHVRPYIYERRFLLCTDHASLCWLLRFCWPEGHLAWWLKTLQDYDFEICR